MTRNLLVAALPFITCVAHGQSRPNIILIMTDQHRFDYLSDVNPNIITPNLDSLCSDGYRFANGYSTSPSSTPARAGLLTGMSPWHHGLLGYSDKISTSYKYEMPRMLANAGYHTAAVGKMHWTPQRNHYGLHELYVDESGRVENPGFVSDYRQWFAQVAPNLNPDSLGIGWNNNDAGFYPLADTLHPTYWTANKSIEVIEKRDQSKPLFLKVSFARPHSPYDPPKRFYDMYQGRDVGQPWIGAADTVYALKTSNPEAALGDFGTEYAMNSRRHYAASVTFIDEQIGRLVAKLKEENLYDNSIIIFISDHGDMLGDHHHWRKTYPYEGSTHVPFIVKLPSQLQVEAPTGHPVSAVAELRDVLPTFLETAGVEIPADMDGVSLLIPLVKGAKAPWREYIDLEHASCYGLSAWVALTDGKQKYVWNYSNGVQELYDLSKDPTECTNRISNKKYAKSLLMWRERMKNHLEERGEKWVKDGELQVLPSVLKSPNFGSK